VTIDTGFDLQIAHGAGLVSQLLSANDRGHWATKEARRRYWHDLTTYMLRNDRGLPRYLDQHVHITITIAWPDRRRRDAANYYNTGKVIVDAVVRAGYLTDDSDRYVTGPDMRRAYGPHEIRLTITPGDRP
jgi:Holliday junction resolvase RusA-like endonuclease